MESDVKMMDLKYEYEINIIGIVITWLEKWRSIVLGVLFFGICGALTYYLKTKNAIEIAKETLAITAAEEIATINVPVISTFGFIKNILIFVIAFVCIHGLIVTAIYIFDKRVKFFDEIGLKIQIPELTNVIDWKEIDKKKGLDKRLAKWKLRGERRIEKDEAIKVNAITIAEILASHSHNSLLIISDGLDEEAKELEKKLKEISKVAIKINNSITHSVEGAKNANVDMVVMFVKIGQSRWNDVFEERNAINIREIGVAGVIVFK